MLIDLHTHTHHSDGTDSPAELMAGAAAAGLAVVGLTDHDSTAGWAQATDEVGRTGVALVPGVELSCTAGGITVHLLSLLHDPADAELLAEMRAARRSRTTRAQEMVRRIAVDHEVTWADVLAQVPAGATLGRPHIADALIARGHVRDRGEAFAGIVAQDSPYYVHHYAQDAADAVRRVRAAGGVPVFAHPRAHARGAVVSDAVIAELADAGLAALEADHRDHDATAREHLRGLAGDLGLLVTGASDYHGSGKPNRLGENTTAPEVLLALQEQARGSIVWP